MANFIDSSKILMYPSAFRAVNPESYLNTEFNLTNTKRLSSYKELNSYIINKDDYYVTFCINGYFFKIKYSDLTGLNLKPLYAYIILKNENSQDTDTYNNLRLTVVNPNENTESTFGVLDINNEFRGLAFTNSPQDILDLEEEAGLNNEFEIHHLQLLDNKGDVVGNKFKLSSLEIRNSFDVNKSIYEYFNTGNLEATDFRAAIAEIDDLTVTDETTLDILKVLNNATLQNDLTLNGALNDVKIVGTKDAQGKCAQATFKQTFNGLNSTIENSNVSNAAISINESGITLMKNGASNSLNLPFNPSGTESKVLVNTAGSSSWVTLSNTAAKSSVVYRDANGDTAVRNLDTTEINANIISLGGGEADTTTSLCLEYDTKTKKHYIKPLNLQKTFIAGNSTNEVASGTPTENMFINRVSISSDGQMKFSAGGLTVASSTALGAVKIGYSQNNQNYPVALSNEKMYVNVPWKNFYHKAEVDENAGISISTPIGIDDPLVVPYATVNTYGVVKPAAVRASAIATNTLTSTSGKYYGVEMDTNGKLFVNVPWENSNTEYDAGSGLYLNNNTLNVKTNFNTVVSSGNSSGKYKTQVDATTNSLYTEIPAATSDGYGVVKVGFGDQNVARLYGVQLTTHKTDDNERNRMFVYVPWTDEHVKSANEHYAPASDSNYTITKSASGGSSLTRGSSNVVTGVTISRDSKGHITDVSLTSGKLPSSDNTQANIYATTSVGTTNVTTNTVNPYIRLFDGGSHRNSIQIVGDADSINGSGLIVYAKDGTIYIKGPTTSTGTTQGKFNYAGSAVTVYGLQTTSSPTFAGMNVKGSLYVKNSSNTTTASISDTGSISATSVTATSFTSGSDIRIKENIEEFKYTKSILDLPIKKFDYIDGPKNQIGCIAQDLQKLYPELVKEDDKGYLSINESKLVYLLIEEVKQLKEELKQVKNDILFLN